MTPPSWSPRRPQPGVILDYNEDNQVVGVEILDVTRRVPLASLEQLRFEVA